MVRFSSRQFAFEIASGITAAVGIMITLVRHVRRASLGRIAIGAQRTRWRPRDARYPRSANR
jgi:hypothetical protein